MNCPICDLVLDAATLLDADGGHPALPGFRCPDGHGVFLPSDVYAEWEGEGPDDEPEPQAVTVDADAVGDVKRAKLCPQDRRIMSRFRVSPGGFWLDRCGACGGAWFDGDEWQATVDAGLHKRLASVFSDAWQRRVEDATVSQERRNRLESAVGSEDLARVDEAREWIWAHPQRHLLLARLSDRPVSDA